MALIVDTNSYVDISYADAYFEDKFGATWSSILTTDKSKLLVTATRILDNFFSWIGEKYDEDQALEFPRYEDDPDDSIVPTKIKQAQCELAQYIYDNGTELEEVSERFRVDEVEVESSFKQSIVPSYVVALVREYGVVATISNKIIEVKISR